jgi:hypothetical protein
VKDSALSSGTSPLSQDQSGVQFNDKKAAGLDGINIQISKKLLPSTQDRVSSHPKE